jgi:uncharacterized protein (DUF433 family)
MSADVRLLERIVSHPEICGGKPTVRGTRIRAVDVLELLSAGMTEAELLADYDELSSEDIRAVMLYAARFIARPDLRVA